MNTFAFATLFVPLVTFAVAETDPAKHLIILSGQSNMVRLDISTTFAPAIHRAFGEENVIIVKDAHSGQPIRRWHHRWKRRKTDAPEQMGDLYDRLMQKVAAATNGESFETVTFVWMQGERDARENTAYQYARSMSGLLSQLESDLRRDKINLVIGRLSDFKSELYRDWNRIRKIQERIADERPRTKLVNTDDLNDGLNSEGQLVKDDLHMSIEGYNELGRRFAEAALDLINES